MIARSGWNGWLQVTQCLDAFPGFSAFLLGQFALGKFSAQAIGDKFYVADGNGVIAVRFDIQFELEDPVSYPNISQIEIIPTGSVAFHRVALQKEFLSRRLFNSYPETFG